MMSTSFPIYRMRDQVTLARSLFGKTGIAFHLTFYLLTYIYSYLQNLYYWGQTEGPVGAHIIPSSPSPPSSPFLNIAVCLLFSILGYIRNLVRLLRILALDLWFRLSKLNWSFVATSAVAIYNVIPSFPLPPRSFILPLPPQSTSKNETKYSFSFGAYTTFAFISSSVKYLKKPRRIFVNPPPPPPPDLPLNVVRIYLAIPPQGGVILSSEHANPDLEIQVQALLCNK